MAGAPRYIGTKLGEIIRAITIDSMHTWRDIQNVTRFSEKELNYHLAQLFNDEAIKKEKGQYFVIPSLEAEWLAYYQLSDTSIESETPTVPAEKKSLHISPQGFTTTRIILVVLLVLSLGLNLTSISTISRLETQIAEQNQSIQAYESTIEELQNDIEVLNNQIKILLSLNEELTVYASNLESQLSKVLTDSSGSSSTTTDTSTRTVFIDQVAICSRIIDGDTFEISSGIRVRLADVDAPEYYESGYVSSTNALSSWILGKQVYLDVDDVYGTDSYGRYVCVVYFAYGSGYLNVNHALLISGYVTLSDYPNEFDPTVWGTPGNIDTSEAIQDVSTSSSSSSSGGNSSSTSGSGPYWASKNSNIYHKPSCYWAQQISPSNLIVFSSKSAAEAAGYRACKVCKP